MGADKKREHGGKGTAVDIQQGRYYEPVETCRYLISEVKKRDGNRGIYSLWMCLTTAKGLRRSGQRLPVPLYWNSLLHTFLRKRGCPLILWRHIRWTCGLSATFCRRLDLISHLSPGMTSSSTSAG